MFRIVILKFFFFPVTEHFGYVILCELYHTTIYSIDDI